MVHTKSRIARIIRAILFSIALLNLGSSYTKAQTPTPTSSEDRERGIQLYQQGDASGAIEALRKVVKENKDDAKAWHYLGLAYLLKQDKDEARKAFGKAATIRVKDLAAALSPSDNHGMPPAKSKNADRYQAAVESVEKYLEVTSNPSEDLITELETLRWYRDFYQGSRHDEEIRSGRDVTTKLRILSKPEPQFSGTRASGIAILHAVFSADGGIKHILVLHKVDPAFDRACIEAAKKIQFTPAIKDGRSVSMILQLEYRREFF